ncbi:glycosyltransferase [Dyadobacter sp. CY343]|uniref:glycosyltransferase n=1 Tax=Dyadobacter sp. CY343 TaxID=2907299 RepID=UPI001F210CA1|nr:glycosyltransferase [Dyadobacter sp. CY343]MCE7058627.1 glycosyltransferase [Dyadobacter sp. CY343]
MKVLHLVSKLGKGGAEKLLVDILPVYKEMGIEVDLLLLSEIGSEPAFLTSLRQKGIKIYHLGSDSVYSPLYILRLRNFLSRHKYDIIHTHLFPALYWIALASRISAKKPVLVYTEHSTQNKRANKGYLRWIEKSMYSSLDKIVAVSNNVRDFLVGRVAPPEQVMVITNGVNIDSFSSAPIYDSSYWLKHFNLPEDSIKLMMTARINYPKDHATLVDALALLPENYYLLLVGDGPDRLVIEQLAVSHNLSQRVVFTGFRQDIPSLMKSVDINILSSAYEGMSGVALEGLASGKPFLGTNVPGINDVVPSSEMLFEYRNAKQLAEKILAIGSMDQAAYQRLIDTGVAHAAKNSLREMASKHLKLYSELLAAC